jgi:hypothetical protein
MKRYKQILEPQEDYGDNLFKSYMENYRLTEKTFNIGKDVDFIYNKFFKKRIDRFRKDDNNLPALGFYGRLYSGELLSKTSKKAHNNNPVDIDCGAFPEGSFYRPVEKQIYISLNFSAIEFYDRKESLSTNDKRAIENELTEHRIKSTIYHELSHWISDSLYNKYIYTMIARAKNISETDPNGRDKILKLLKQGGLSIHTTNYEVDAQIHAIKQLKRTFRKGWDYFTFKDLLFKIPSLRMIAKDLYSLGDDVYKEWMKDLTKRMHREKLLGKNMREFPKYSMIESIEDEDLFKV